MRRCLTGLRRLDARGDRTLLLLTAQGTSVDGHILVGRLALGWQVADAPGTTLTFLGSDAVEEFPQGLPTSTPSWTGGFFCNKKGF